VGRQGCEANRLQCSAVTVSAFQYITWATIIIIIIIIIIVIIIISKSSKVAFYSVSQDTIFFLIPLNKSFEFWYTISPENLSTVF